MLAHFPEQRLVIEPSKLSYLGERSEPRENARPSNFAARSRVLARLVSLAQIGELARRLKDVVCNATV